MFSNLVVRADNALPRRALLARAAATAGPKGTVYVVTQLDPSSGLGRGQTLRARVAFRVKDGGREEPVRDLSLEGFMPKKMKKDLVAAGTDTYLYEEEGSMPFSVRSRPIHKRRSISAYCGRRRGGNSGSARPKHCRSRRKLPGSACRRSTK